MRLSLCVFIVRLLVYLLVPSPALYPCCVVLFLRHLSPEFSPQEAKITFLASALLGALRAACRRPPTFALGGAAAAAPSFLAAALALIGPRPLRAAAATVMNC